MVENIEILNTILKTIDFYPDAVLIFDSKGIVQGLNGKLEKLLNIQSNEIIGHLCNSHVLKSLRRVEPNLIDLISNRQDFDQPNILIQQDQQTLSIEHFASEIGGGKYLLIQSTPITADNGDLIAIFQTIRDITEKVQAEILLAENEEKYSLLFRQSIDGIIITTLAGTILDLNPNARLLMSQHLLAENPSDLTKIPEFARIITHINHQNKKNVQREYFFEEKLKKSSDEFLYWEISCQMIEFQNEKCWQFIIRDTSEKQKLIDERIRADKLESIGLLAGGIAHDFNNILTGILGNVELIDTENLSADQKSDLNNMREGVFRAMDLTRQLLTFSKAGQPNTQPENLIEIVQNSEKLVMRGSKSKLIMNYPLDLPLCFCDRGQITQVVNNLLINANQAMPQGGIIHLNLSKKEVKEKSNSPIISGLYDVIELSDQGMGIPTEIQSKIFTPYFTTKKSGTGLGLATSYSIIKRHKGHIYFNSQAGKGTTFYVYLPADPNLDRKQNLPAQKKVKFSPFNLKILVMDDDINVSRILERILQKLNCSVDVVADGDEAIAKYKLCLETGKKYDLVIMDLTVPGGKGGRETIGELKKLDENVKAIVSSGYSDEVSMSNYQTFGFIDYLPKPYRLEQINDFIANFCSKYKG